ncbi:sigma-70 family RNA polymerase sigma factor [Bacillus sp. Marseille-Q1617]|uniref:sigma-70 family RNA polymerase sigma factor n=1 Tax=Bacillus sp. Marseille-Q1617 TaxID=2736887 RepID=UPI00158BA238|nr:sigma-70 family RNA polymerase sigma factor [Bacillus sp. Marseille-Q1617]
MEDTHKNHLIESLIDEYEISITKLAYFYVQDWPAAQDICQDVFIKVYDALDQFNHQSSYKTWIYRIAINKCKDYKKSAYFRKSTVVDKFHRFFNKEIAATPEQVLLQTEEQTSLSAQIFTLPVKYREIILLYYYEELTTREISELLNINSSTVRTRLERGRQKLKTMLERRDKDE